MISVRSLRVRLSILYVVLTMSWMSAVGVVIYLYLRQALSASRAETMVRREQRLVNYVNDISAHLHGLSLQDQLREFMEANTTPNDIIRIYDLKGTLLYKDGWPSTDVVSPDQNCTQPCLGEMTLHHHPMRHRLPYHDARRSACEAFPRWLNGRALRLAGPHHPLIRHRGPLDAAGVDCRRITAEPSRHGTGRPHDARCTPYWKNLKRRVPVPNTRDEIQRLSETLNELLKRLDVAVSRLRQFTSDVSHDLRTSTTVMLATAQLALRIERPPEEYKTALQVITQECQATSHLLDDLLEIATADIGDSKVERLPVNLADVLDEVSGQMQAHANVKHQTMECRRSDEGWILGDLQMLRRLTSILLDNAVKYTPKRGTISASVVTSETTVALEISDTGVGITPESTTRIFDRFFRADPARARDGGRGLGLAIAKWIADSHGSTIHVSSAMGRGSTFTVRFPRFHFEQ